MRLILGVIASMLIVALFWFLRLGEPATKIPLAGEGAAVVSEESEVEAAKELIESDWIAPMITYDTYESVHGALPGSLEGSVIPFHLEVTIDGELVVNQQLRRLFDYFFTLDGEEPMETILARVKELLDTHLPEPAKTRAMEILEQYVQLKKDETALARQMDDDFKTTGRRPSVAELRTALRDLRASNLDPEVYEAFYGVEDQRDDYTVSRLEIQQDTSLSEEEKKEALKALEYLLPESDQKHLQQERQTESVYSDVEQARAEGASDAEIFHIREQAFGTKAAQRYAEADAKKAQWESRISAYRAERSDILNTPGISEDDKEYQIEQLRLQHFEGNELKRIPVIDRIRDAQ